MVRNEGSVLSSTGGVERYVWDLLRSLAARTYMTASRKPRVTVITLHRVGGLSKIQPAHVERCFRFLATHFKVVCPSKLASAEHERRTAVVTIDDGHADAYRHIFPIAKAIGVPISLCIPTDFFFRRQWLWFDKVAWAMDHAKRGKVAQVKGLEVCLDDPQSFARLRRHLKRCPPEDRNVAIDQLLRSLDLAPPSSPPEEYRALREAELREMLSCGLVEIVGHTVTHTIATVLAERDLADELRQSKDEWEAFCGEPIMSFCYPNGNPGDFDQRTATTVRRAGYRYAFTQLEGTNPIHRMNPFEMKRVHIHWRPGVCDKVVSGLVDIQNSVCCSGPDRRA